MVKVAIIGASGKSGQLILKESLARGYQVTAIVRNKSKITQDVPIIEKEIQQLTRDDLESFDVVVNAFASSAGNESDHEVLGKKLIELLQGTNTRLIVVGGAGSLYVDEAKTTRLIDTKEFPQAYYAIAFNMAKSFEDLKASKDLKWTFFSPSAIFDPTGKRTGQYRLGEDNLLLNSENKPYISYADYALALVDEIEQAKYVNKRFTAVSV
ncbi:NAD-dependent epimerase/dehydratase [Sporodiniella umbellata]|nr:NAD-dependent epimerase/dehydratase [Sporodiniella umbellata]